MTEQLQSATVEVARTCILASVSPLAAVDLPLTDALGACLAAPVVAPGPMPPFDNAAMDGFAVAAAGVAATLPASAVPIATGQRLPAGCDAVVPLERIDPGGRVAGDVRPNDHVRRRGEEFVAGALLLEVGAELTPPAVGLLSGAGVASVRVHRRPRVAIVVTGDELLPLSRRAADELIPDANGPMLAALVAGAGGVLGPLRHVPDDREELRAALLAAASGADVVLTSGGASVGRPDHVVGLVDELGAVEVHQLAVKPGRPTSFGRVGATPALMLPGNPFALLAGFELLGRPLLRRLAGAALPLRNRVSLPVAVPLAADASRLRVAPVQLLDGRVHPLDAAGAAMLSGAAQADGLVFVPPGRTVEPGEAVEVELWPRA
jgi:molybdopterin molybdotransferase